MSQWSERALNEACESRSWQDLLDELEESLKSSNKLTRRFSELSEFEQAILVEQELRMVQIYHSFSNINSNFSCNYLIANHCLPSHKT
jgi:hypothetical protein